MELRDLLDKKTVWMKLLIGSFLFTCSFYISMSGVFRLLIAFLISYLITISIADPGKGFKRQLFGVSLLIVLLGFGMFILFVFLRMLV